MKKDLKIMMGDKPLRLDPRAAVNVKQENPLTLKEGRIGYLHICKPGEELRKPIFEMGTYENGTFIPQANG